MDNPEYFGMLGNLRKISKIKDEDKFYKELTNQINDPNPLRSKVLTLHLLVEYWLNKILEELGYSKSRIDDLTFHKKNEELHDNKILDDLIYENVKIINRIRNVYAHEIDLDKLEPKINDLLNGIKFSLDFETSSDDRFLAIAVQTMFQLEEKYYDIKYADKIKVLTDEEVKQKLVKEGRLFWQYCDLLDKKQGFLNETEYVLKCPYCFKGKISRFHDDTPGFKESYFIPCNNCKLSGDGSTLLLETIKNTSDSSNK